MIFCFLFILFRERKFYLDAYWDLVFEHNSGNGDFFSGNNDPTNCRKQNLYSNLINLKSQYYINGYYEFLLEYPEISGHNRWIQSKNPIDDLEQTGKTATGYSPISISWPGRYWGGLCKSKNAKTLLDGSTSSSDAWWFSIGSNMEYESENGIPGPCISLNKDTCTIVKHVKLYARLLPPTGQKTETKLNVIPILVSILFF